jgi:hypothetical protein
MPASFGERRDQILFLLGLILRQSRRRFGPPVAFDEVELLAIEDIARLERLMEAIPTAVSSADLLRTL